MSWHWKYISAVVTAVFVNMMYSRDSKILTIKKLYQVNEYNKHHFKYLL